MTAVAVRLCDDGGPSPICAPRRVLASLGRRPRAAYASRAANFSAAALQNLDEFGLLRGADIISSVSGGGLAGAYYALHSPAMNWDVLRHKLNTNFLAIFLRKWAAPWHWPQAAFTDETKTDIMAAGRRKVPFRAVRLSAPGWLR